MSTEFGQIKEVQIVVLVAESHDKGGGHVKRQVALVEEATDRGHEVFVIGQLSVASVVALKKLGANVVPVINEIECLTEALDLLSSLRSRASRKAVIVDDYGLLPHIEQLLDSCRMVVVFTDGQKTAAVPQLVVDSAITTTKPHSDELGTISGLDAAIIGKSFKALRHKRIQKLSNTSFTRGKIVVNFGSSDQADLSLAVHDLLKGMKPERKFEIVLGPQYNGGLASKELERTDNVSTKFGRSLGYLSALRNAGAAIGASGLSAYERAFIALPSLNVAVASNQSGIARILTQAGAAIEAELPIHAQTITNFLLALDDPEIYLGMASAGLRKLDGQGAKRVINRIEEGA